MKQSRSETYKAALIEPDPEAVWLIDLSRSCGLYQATGMSISPISWLEIDAWANANMMEGCWVRQVVRGLSKDYVSMYHEAEDPACQSPLQADITVQRQMVAMQLQRFIRAKG